MYSLVVLPFQEHNSFLMHEASTYIFQYVPEDLEVPFVLSKTHGI